jgi:hypothetical protein
MLLVRDFPVYIYLVLVVTLLVVIVNLVVVVVIGIIIVVFEYLLFDLLGKSIRFLEGVFDVACMTDIWGSCRCVQRFHPVFDQNSNITKRRLILGMYQHQYLVLSIGIESWFWPGIGGIGIDSIGFDLVLMVLIVLVLVVLILMVLVLVLVLRYWHEKSYSPLWTHHKCKYIKNTTVLSVRKYL